MREPTPLVVSRAVECSSPNVIARPRADGSPSRAVLLARSVEAVLVVVEANRTLSSEIDVAVSRLPQNNIIGAVITKFDAKSAGVRYGGHDYYTYGRDS